MVEMAVAENFGTMWRGAFGSFMISRPSLGCSHWLEFVYTQNAAMMSFNNVMRQHLDYVQDVIFSFSFGSVGLNFS